ncbi:DUF3237 domain-containing protein [Cryptosporangium aurantiacum]|uniref:UPF0311 protein SAMN05443668_105298 n=1 Tax=Cryptosporangium aurantiacum TaxID=134849 RepID=A0A1M7QSS1_9ACTN|nr:DUF3237 domain-containing protein [Cryptosporangium aurantiacum]SHN34723.1 Protein of unknown function [Cryptosporangium aurantiacum]
MSEPLAPGLELLARFTVTLADPLEIGDTPWGRRRVIGITGGRFAGPRLSGEILPGGADWQVVHADGSASIDTRYTLRTDDGVLVSLATRGVRHGPPEVLAALAERDDVDPASYYFKVGLTFEVADPAYGWLNRVVAVGSAVRHPDAVIYDAYAVT